jgi:arylformamidase
MLKALRLGVMVVCAAVWMSGCVNAATTKDVAYGLDKDQAYDVYVPPQGERGAPVMVMIHGGAWKIGDKSYRPVWQGKTAHWLPQGAVFVSVNYRMLPEAQVGVQAQDVAAALAHIQAYGAKQGWDMSRMVVMGHSAGAHLAVLVSVDNRYREKFNVAPWLATISLDSGALNVPQIMSQRHYGFYDDVFGSTTSLWESYSPLHQIRDARIPLLLVCSSKRDISCAQAKDFSAAIQSQGGSAFVLPQDMTHGDINDEVGKDAAYTAQIDSYLQHIGWMPAKK